MRIINQLSILLLFWAAGELLAACIAPVIRFPGTIVGMVLLYLALLSGMIQESHIQECADLFLGNIGFFFVPVVVGVITVTGFSLPEFFQLGITIALSTLLTLGVVSLTVQAIIQRKAAKE